MSPYFSNEKSAFLFLFCIIFSGILPVAEPIFGSVSARRTGRPLSTSDIVSYERRHALEAYKKRNAEIDLWIEENSIPDYNNAALLYYQALLLKPDHDQKIIKKFYDVFYERAKPNTQIRTFLGEWLPSMKISEIASRIPQCTWGIWPEIVWPEEKRSNIFLTKSFIRLSYIIAVDAFMLASEGHHRAALERCMAIRRIARHLSHDSKLHISSGSVDGIAVKMIRRILGDIPLDADTLTWLQGQLAIFQEAPFLLERTLQEYLKADTDTIQSYSIARLRGMLLKRAADERARQHIRNSTDDQIRNQALEAVKVFYDSIFGILHSDKNAEQKYVEIQKATTYPINKDVIEPLMKIYYEFGAEINNLMSGTGMDLTEEQQLSEIQKIIDKSSEPNTIELLTRVANAVGKDVDFGFLVNREMTDEQKRAKMQKVIYELGDAFVIETSTFGFHWNAISARFESPVRYMAHINSLKAAVELYLIKAKTGQLPEELPDNLPKDPYTGQDFSYKKNEDGFSLGCRSQNDFFERGKERFTFKALKRN